MMCKAQKAYKQQNKRSYAARNTETPGKSQQVNAADNKGKRNQKSPQPQ